MKRSMILCLSIVLAMVFISTGAFAEPSAKATAQCGNLSVVPLTEKDSGNWTQIFELMIKTPTGKDLFIDVSLECGLTTDTKVMSRLLAKAIADAEAIVKVQVKIDGVPVEVNESGDSEIIFARRHQTLIAEFAGLYDLECIEFTYGCYDCEDTVCTITPYDPDSLDPEINTCDGTVVVTGITIDDSAECYEQETLQLILDTMQANSFNFIAPDLVAGEHTVTVEAKLEYDVDTYEIVDPLNASGVSEANAYLGNGSVTIETVRMIKGEDVVVDLD